MTLTTTRTPVPHPIKAHLASRRLTVRWLAGELHVNEGTVGRCINGWDAPWPKLRQRSAEVLGVPADELWREGA